jgi:hypothetical protein
MSIEVTHFFLRLRNTMKLYHWQTLSYPRHKASDQFIGDLDRLSDSFVEVYIGRYGRDAKSKKDTKLQLPALSEKDVVEYLKEARDWLSTDLPPLLKKEDTELFNLRDELISVINQCLYLFTLS